ncbi:MAG: hypothetical protein LBI33_08090 [Propionibacteriaceae bacterium]|nr:hypothetical protein [Propionibacteriaceae bacterium]
MIMATVRVDQATKSCHEPPRDPASDPFYSEPNQVALRKSIAQAERGEVVVKTLEELEAMAR